MNYSATLKGIVQNHVFQTLLGFTTNKEIDNGENNWSKTFPSDKEHLYGKMLIKALTRYSLLKISRQFSSENQDLELHSELTKALSERY